MNNEDTLVAIFEQVDVESEYATRVIEKLGVNSKPDELCFYT